MAGRGELARQWFLPGDGIDRHVIVTDIQRYLGNDATVRPGVGTGDNQGVQGYWIKAYRNLTNAMIADLRADSLRWRQERQSGAGGDSYESSSARLMSMRSGTTRRDRDNDSPIMDDYPMSGPGRQGDGRAPRQPDTMMMDAPQGRMPPSQYGGQDPYYQQDVRGGQYQQDPNRGYQQPGGRGQQYSDQAMADMYGNPDPSGRYRVDPRGQGRMPPNYNQAPQGAPVGYVQQGDWYVPTSQAYQQQPGMMAPAGNDQYYGGQPPRQQQQQQQQLPPQRVQDLPGQPGRGGIRDPRDPRERDPRVSRDGYGGQQDWAGNPYPSPAMTDAETSNIRGGPPQPRFEDSPVKNVASSANYYSGHGRPGQQQVDQYGNPLPPGYGQYNQQDPYGQQGPPGRDPNQRPPGGAGPPPRESNSRPSGSSSQRDDRDRRHRRNG